MTTPEQAAKEIKAILEKHDLAAMIVLQGPDQMTFLNQISPSWSCAKLNEQTGELRIKAKRADYASREDQKRCVEATVGMILGFMGQAERNHGNMQTVAEMLGRHFDISHNETLEG